MFCKVCQILADFLITFDQLSGRIIDLMRNFLRKVGEDYLGNLKFLTRSTRSPAPKMSKSNIKK